MMYYRIVESIGILATKPLEGLGRYIIFVGHSFYRIVFPPVKLKLLLAQMEFVGNRSFGVIVMAGMMVGGIFGFQLGDLFRIFGAESLIGAAAAFILSTQLAPVVGAMLVTGRAGSAMAAEIATMRVNEQIDAMRVMAVNPYGYLSAPRLLATMLMLPVLTAIFVISGVFSSYVIGVMFFNVDVGVFIEKIKWLVAPSDVWSGLQKSLIFGIIIATVGCFKGFSANGGAKGVGQATTSTVVISMMTILITNFFLSYLATASLFFMPPPRATSSQKSRLLQSHKSCKQAST